MKKISFLCLVFLLCLPFVSYAAGIGGVETQGQGKFSIGLDQEFVFDRDVKDKTFEAGGAYSYTDTFFISGAGEFIELDISGVVGDEICKSELDRMSRSMIKLNYGLFDNLDIFARLGEANFRWKIKGESPDSGTFTDPISGNSGTYEGVEESTGIFKGENAFAWGLGINGAYPLENEWSLGIQAQYLRHKNTLKCSLEEKLNGSYEVTAGPDTGQTGSYGTNGYEESWDAKATVQEWQIAPYIAKKLGKFIPYLGMRYSDKRIDYKEEEEKMKFKADDNFGVFLGTDYRINENLSLNLEGSFIDETAMSFAGTYRF